MKRGTACTRNGARPPCGRIPEIDARNSEHGGNHIGRRKLNGTLGGAVARKVATRFRSGARHRDARLQGTSLKGPPLATRAGRDRAVRSRCHHADHVIGCQSVVHVEASDGHERAAVLSAVQRLV